MNRPRCCRHRPVSPHPWARSPAAAEPDGSLVTVLGAHTFPARYGGLTQALIGSSATGGPGVRVRNG
ncbi:MAG: hypothetical protein QOI78_530 [Actinomycetota bacterium]|nr:hypothetical protein [Actinomycetota bacterium]